LSDLNVPAKTQGGTKATSEQLESSSQVEQRIEGLTRQLDDLRSKLVDEQKNQTSKREWRLQPYTDWDKDDRSQASRVCSSYSAAGFILKLLYESGDRALKTILEGWAPTVYRCHKAVAHFLVDMRGPAQGGSHYWYGFDWLYEQSCKFFPNIEIELQDDADYLRDS
jgi:hypothetical protein